eukprot:4502646-Pleurochrysis_carterae.AAC.3
MVTCKRKGKRRRKRLEETRTHVAAFVRVCGACAACTLARVAPLRGRTSRRCGGKAGSDSLGIKAKKAVGRARSREKRGLSAEASLAALSNWMVRTQGGFQDMQRRTKEEDAVPLLDHEGTYPRWWAFVAMGRDIAGGWGLVK